MKKQPVAHRWVIDAIEEGVARVEQDGGPMLTVPAWLLPAGATEGQLFSVSRTDSAAGCTIAVTMDAAGTSAAIAASSVTVEKMTKSSKKRDAGGDVAL